MRSNRNISISCPNENEFIHFNVGKERETNRRKVWFLKRFICGRRSFFVCIWLTNTHVACSRAPLTNSLRSMSIDVISQWSKRTIDKIYMRASGRTQKKEHNDNGNAKYQLELRKLFTDCQCVVFRKSERNEKWKINTPTKNNLCVYSTCVCFFFSVFA